MSSLVPFHPFQLPAGWNLTRPNNTCNNNLTRPNNTCNNILKSKAEYTNTQQDLTVE
jgi:hypothetical protein